MAESEENQIPEEIIFDATLRPREWKDYIGQEKIKENLKIIIGAAKKRRQTPDHLLFYGPAGLGKTSLAHIVAEAMGANIKATSGPAIEKAGDLASILTNLNPGDILFIDECHRLNRLIAEILYPAMEDFKLHLILGRGPMARTMEMDIPHFTLIGATTRISLMPSPLRSRFGAIFQLGFYSQNDIEKIIKRSSEILNIKIDDAAIKILAKASRATPRVANRLLKRARDFSEVCGQEIITKDSVNKILELLEIDNLGLELADRKIINTIIEKFNGGPVGLQTIAAATSEEEDTILDIYEPYLMQLGFIERTPKGRMATKLAYERLGKKIGKENQNTLL